VSLHESSVCHEGAIKWWIGNAAEDGQWATVFARLRIPTEGAKGGVKDHGVHAFICPLRHADGSLVNGVEIRDCGYKVGLNGAADFFPEITRNSNHGLFQ
jgi:acyl-CoA oxidase